MEAPGSAPPTLSFPLAKKNGLPAAPVDHLSRGVMRGEVKRKMVSSGTQKIKHLILN